MAGLLDEIKNRAGEWAKAPGTIAGLIKSKITNVRVLARVSRDLTNKIGPGSIVGAENYNIHANTIKNLLKQNKSKEALEYVKSQKAKVDQEVREEFEAKRKKRKEVEEKFSTP